METPGADEVQADHDKGLINAAQDEASALSKAGQAQHPLPDSVPGFKILSELGRGGMGVVYKAIQLSTKRTVALKVMLAGPFASGASSRRFRREVELTARFQHPAIVRVLESGEAATGQLFYAMDFVQGDHLDRWLEVAEPDLCERLRLFEAVCEAVEYAHAQGVVHRDLKPANVLVDTAGNPHILDFGLSKATDLGDVRETLTLYTPTSGPVMGTLPYLSPEQASGNAAEVDAQTDVYALGVMLYQAVYGLLPIDTRGNPTEVIRRILEEQPLLPPSSSKRVDRELETIVFKTLRKEKAERYASARELREDITRYLRHEPILARQQSSLYIIRKRLRRHRAKLAAAVVVMALLSVSLWGGRWWKNRELEGREAVNRDAVRRFVLAIQDEVDAGRLEFAFGQARSVFDQYPDLPEVRLVWAQVQYRLGWKMGGASALVDEALGALRVGITKAPEPWAYRMLMADIYERSGNPAWQAARARALQEAPDTAEAWYIRSYATLDLDTARRCILDAVRRDPKHQRAWERAAYLQMRAGYLDEALMATRRLIELGASPYTWIVYEGRILIKKGQHREALAAFARARQLRSADYHFYRSSALAHLCLCEYLEAIADYSTAIDLRGGLTLPWLHYFRATPLWISGRFEEVAAEYRLVRSERGHPSFADVRLFLVLRDWARRLHEEGDATQAQNRLEEADSVLRIARGSVPATSWLGRILACAAGDLAPGELVAAADPQNGEQMCEAFYYAGEVCLLNGRPIEARQWFEKSVGTGQVLDEDEWPPDPMSEYHLALWRLTTLSEEENDTSAVEDNAVDGSALDD